MSEKVLFVDDDANILSAYQRQLRRRVTLDTALGGMEALSRIADSGPYAIVISDMRMPEMDGVEFLTRVRALAPNTVRMMLTGNADQKTAMDAVNEGCIFRFLTKPCSHDALTQAIDAGMEQYRLITAEAELLEKTLTGSMAMVTEMMAAADPRAFGRAAKVRHYIREIGQEHGYGNMWQLELAAMLAQIGQMTVPAETLAKARRMQGVSPAEEEMLRRIPETSRNLIGKIPRMEPVAQIVYYQDKQFDGAGFPVDGVAGAAIPWGARVLKILSDFVTLEMEGKSRSVASRALCARHGWYDPDILKSVCQHFDPMPTDLPVVEGDPTTSAEEKAIERAIQRARADSQLSVPSTPPGKVVFVNDLRAGDVLARDVRTQHGALLFSSGATLTEADLERLINHASVRSVKQPLFIVPRR